MNAGSPRLRLARALAGAAALWLAAACGPDVATPAEEPRATPSPDAGSIAVRLAPLYDRDAVESPVEPSGVDDEPAGWRFGEEAAPGTSWAAGPGVVGLELRTDRLAGRTGGPFGVVDLAREPGESDDVVEAIEVRLRVDRGRFVDAAIATEAELDLGEFVARWREDGRRTAVALDGEDEVKTYTVEVPRTMRVRDVRHVVVRPSDAPDARFVLVSVRLLTRRAALAEVAPGLGWHHLAHVYKETLVARVPETIVIEATLPENPWLDVAIGTVDVRPVTFTVVVEPRGGTAAGVGGAATVFERAVTTPDAWQPLRIDLPHGGRDVRVRLALSGPDAGAVGLWGAPVVRSAGARAGADAPQGVILVMADTLRPDHLQLYGYERSTAPELAARAAEGVRFDDCIAQGTWTKVSAASLLTSLYPTTVGVAEPNDRVPAAATTLAEAYQQAGYATLSLSSVFFSGKMSNLHQGFETVHEVQSLSRRSSKTSREYVSRLLPWLERHRDVPFFVFLHVFDPHDPFEADPPYDVTWADPTRREAHERARAAAKAQMEDGILHRFGMPTRAEVEAAGLDPDNYVGFEKDQYDGSILGMDVEMGRMFATLRNLDLDERTLVAFTSDHGEEFFEHGRMFHGQSVYGELAHVPLFFRWPGRVPGDVVVEHTVRSLDVMPTLLELSGIDAPAEVQGQSLVPLFEAPGPGASAAPWRPLPAVTEKAATKGEVAPPPRETESVAIVFNGWKLVHHVKRLDDGPEYELFDHDADPLDRVDVSGAHPDMVARLAEQLDAWRAAVEDAALASDAEAAAGLSDEELKTLEALGYVGR